MDFKISLDGLHVIGFKNRGRKNHISTSLLIQDKCLPIHDQVYSVLLNSK